MVMVGRCWKVSIISLTSASVPVLRPTYLSQQLLSILGLCSSHLLLILLSNSTRLLWEQLSHSTVFCCTSKISTAIAVYSMHIYNYQ